MLLTPASVSGCGLYDSVRFLDGLEGTGDELRSSKGRWGATFVGSGAEGLFFAASYPVVFQVLPLAAPAHCHLAFLQEPCLLLYSGLLRRQSPEAEPV